MANDTGLDYSQPLATLLRESTRKAHENVEASPAAVAMVRGELDKDTYVTFLIMLWTIYSTFEQALEKHATNPVLEPTYNPTLLARAPALASDIAYFLDVPESAWQMHEKYRTVVASPPPALSKYISRIKELADSDEPAPLLAHAYVRYLGDLSGGQTIRHAIAKAYGIDEALGSGLSFFAFKELRSAKPASQGEMRRIKDWFRDGMNKGGGDDTRVKALIVEEANHVFDLNRGVFQTIDVPVKKAKEESRVVAVGSDEGTYSVSSVATVILAVGLGHFLLTVGGFTGQRGWSKLTGFYDFMDNALKAFGVDVSRLYGH